MSSVKRDVSDNEPLYSNQQSTTSAPSHSFSLQCFIATRCEMNIMPLIVIQMSPFCCIVLHCPGTAGQIQHHGSDIIQCSGLLPPSRPNSNTHTLNFNHMFEQSRQHWVLDSKLQCKQCPARPGSARPGLASGLMRGLHAPPQ